jgi:hypothetical protein
MPDNDNSIESQLAGHRKRNNELRKTFESRNVDFQQIRPVDFHFWAWSQRDAAVLARSLYQMGFLIRLLAPAAVDTDPDRWTIEGGARISLAEALSDELAEKLVRLASAEDTIFDGWGTSI